ncbi:methionine--tRNA ligase [Bradyrhizobium sp. NP1]|uniref:methionine--tRNA ligase n=1 Tax=Bradyrhizobium sp. NP1 TaxID=3049772 RepID=UPI0025A52F66|nr:methionine--tRNA ligase [Bradyrhizobium sp. NP1]WJR74951.1 methionine--tRNA ligase [Bradyrhizobium sp. NP1]
MAAKKKSSKRKAAKKAKTSKRVGKAAAASSRAKSKGAKKRLAKKTARKPAKATKAAGKRATKKSAKKAAAKGRAASGKTARKPSATAAKAPPAPTPEKPKRPKPAAKPNRAVDTRPAPTATVSAPSRSNRFYITTAIAYPNGTPHIGHAYEAIATDALARFQRLDGKDVFFLTGTDEHGLKMVQTAQNEGLPTADLAARNAGRFKAMDERLDVSFDRFIRTTEAQHHRSSQEIWRRMQENGDIYIDAYAGWYSVRDEAYYAEDETTVGEDSVRRGPQGTPVEWVEEKSYFFRLSAYQDRLLALYESQPDFIGPDARRNEVMSFVRRGLKDLSISRTTFDWGVKVPNDPEHVMYVWVDALTNYITGVGFPDEGDPNWHYWPADLHIIGKDIIRFHAVFWPAFLMSAGIALPKRVYAHGFLFNRGEKMSKSVGNVVDPFNLADQYGVDQIRYFFLREVAFGQDGSYNHEAIVARINADLANDLGNLAQRSLSMIAKQFGGVLPEPGAFSDNDKTILAQADGMIAIAREAMATQQIHQWLNAVWAVVAEANRYFAGEAPWALAKTDPPRQKTVLYVTAEVIRQIAILAQPAMPAAAAKLLDALGIEEGAARQFDQLGGAGRIAPGTVLPAPQAVFPRYIEPTAAE